MVNELLAVLKNLNETGIELIKSEENNWFKLTDLTELNFNTNSCRLVANIIISDDRANAVTLCMYKDMFRMIRYSGIDPVNYTCKEFKSIRISTDMDSEEEFFQQSTIEDFDGLVYDEYKAIKEIILLMNKHLWS